MSLLDLIFPKKCVSCGEFGNYFCDSCKRKIEYLERPICPICQRQAIGGRTHPGCKKPYSLDGLIVACRYKNPIKRAIFKVKYKWVTDIGDVLVNICADKFYKFDSPSNLTLVPIPLHKKRKNWRGFNQAEILAKILAKKFSCNYSELLIRNRETKTQVGLSKKERWKNVRGVFAINLGAKVIGKNLLLVDDVYTSGATMVECAKVLKRTGAKSVWGMAVALG